MNLKALQTFSHGGKIVNVGNVVAERDDNIARSIIDADLAEETSEKPTDDNLKKEKKKIASDRKVATADEQLAAADGAVKAAQDHLDEVKAKIAADKTIKRSDGTVKPSPPAHNPDLDKPSKPATTPYNPSDYPAPHNPAPHNPPITNPETGKKSK